LTSTHSGFSSAPITAPVLRRLRASSSKVPQIGHRERVFIRRADRVRQDKAADDVDAIADGLACILSDDAFRLSLGAAGLRRLNDFSWDNCVRGNRRRTGRRD
jgi:glycosyltransferase involved in cell wall biosynthesis